MTSRSCYDGPTGAAAAARTLSMTKGILQNNAPREHSAFDRKQVLNNTEQNSKLGAEGAELRQSLAQAGHKNKSTTKYPKTKAPAALKWDEQGIHEHDLERGQTEEITEPKTPFLGSAADTEYYDDEETVPNDLDLGEAEDSEGPPVQEYRIAR